MHSVVASRRTVAISLGLAYVSTTVVWTSYAMLAVALPFHFQVLGFSVVQYGIAIAVLAFGMLLTESFWGVLAFRIANARTILGLGFAVTLVYVGIGEVTSYLELVLLLGLLGALLIFQVPLIRWMALTALGPGTGSTGTGIYGLFSGGGLVLGTTLGPLIFVRFGFADLALLSASIFVVGVLLTVILPWRAVALPPRQSGLGRHVREVATRPFALVVSLVVLAFIAKSLILNFVQYYSVDLFHGTPTEAGYVIGAGQGTLLVAGAVLGILIDRWGAGRAAPFGFVVVLGGVLGTFFASSFLEMVGATFLIAIGLGWLSATLLPLALAPVPGRLQGTAIGVVGSFEDFGLLVGPIMIGAAYGSFGARSIFLVVGGVALAGVLLSLLVRDGRVPVGLHPKGPIAAGGHLDVGLVR
jgi:NNP family nitrate/nitrite transporter-like MFS transporter